ncbi:MAG: GspH/FimT family pseudopilin [Desulfosarcina sp.]|nr:GspH/FimT family pseudopilin [Desulfosarcina sp.]MBC2743352.1 GspH/FimT family pseudopilin [Desulfosarcina sp.]MBC2766262.1 prepilin-type N-terminal cleavage/methylation domain-containing protein [Desulfosarcina sp.]
MRGNSGFSLFELLTVIGIIAVVSAIAIPNMIAWRNRTKLGDGARDIYSAFQLAKSMAAKENNDVTVFFAPSGGLARDYILFIDDGSGTGDLDSDGIPDGANNGVQDGTERILSSRQLPNGVNIDATTFAGHAVAFGGNGLPDTIGNAQISNTAGDIRRIFVSMAGRVRIQY